MAAQQEKRKERPSALRSIIAGSTAGAVEIGTIFIAPQLFEKW
jgi:solute carrier family 25 citrate transporter 1